MTTQGTRAARKAIISSNLFISSCGFSAFREEDREDHEKIMMVIIWWYVKTIRIMMDSDGLCVITGNSNHVIIIGILWAFPWLFLYDYEMMGLLWDDNTWLLWWALCNHVIIMILGLWWAYDGIMAFSMGISQEFAQFFLVFPGSSSAEAFLGVWKWGIGITC